MNLSGEEWRRARNILSPAFTSTKLKTVCTIQQGLVCWYDHTVRCFQRSQHAERAWILIFIFQFHFSCLYEVGMRCSKILLIHLLTFGMVNVLCVCFLTVFSLCIFYHSKCRKTGICSSEFTSVRHAIIVRLHSCGLDRVEYQKGLVRKRQILASY